MRSVNIAKQILDIEIGSDGIRWILVSELTRAFVPFNSADVFTSSRNIDDIHDYAATIVDEMEALNVSLLPQYTK
jgi:uncharacterized protein Yka (UPF0111/DUF47 family)